jgi:hypothetical protein
MALESNDAQKKKFEHHMHHDEQRIQAIPSRHVTSTNQAIKI